MDDQKKDIAIQRILTVFREKWWIILLSIILSLIAAFIVTEYFMQEQYQASVSLYANMQTDTNDITQSALNTNAALINDYRELALSRTVSEKVSQKLKEKGIENFYPDKTLVSLKSNSRIFLVSIVGKDRVNCTEYANTLAEVLIDEIKRIVISDIRKNPEDVSALAHTESVVVIDPAIIPSDPISPSIKVNLALGFFIGTIIGLIILYLIYLIDRSIKSPEDYEAYFDLPVLGIIPKFIPDEDIIKSTQTNKRKKYKKRKSEEFGRQKDGVYSKKR